LTVWAAGSLLATLVRRHWHLAAAMVLAIPLGMGLAWLVDTALGSAAQSAFLAVGVPVDGLPIQLVLGMALTSLASREMSRPFRTSGGRLVLVAAAGALLLPAAAPLRVVAAVLVATATASMVRYAIGSPVSVVSAVDARDDLRDLGVVAEPVAGWADGIREATTSTGERIAVRIIGRDEWDAQISSSVWRFLWYRKGGRLLRLSARQQVEHQAYLLLLAGARGVPVTPVVGAGTSRTGDSLVATEVVGEPIAALPADALDDAFLRDVWRSLAALHDAGIAHGGIDGTAVRRSDDGRVVLGSFDRADPIVEPSQVHADRAQLLVTTALRTGSERAVAAAVEAVGPGDASAPLVSYLQDAALDPDLRDEVDRADLSLDDLRAATAAAAGIDEPELQKVWRVTWGSLLRLAGLAIVGYLLISQLTDIGLDTIWSAITSADPLVLLAALLVGQLPRVATAGSLQTASPSPVPLERVTRLQFATTFVNLAVPSTAARAAVSIRFFQRSGATAAGAVSAGALDSVAGFVAQLSLLIGLLALGTATFGWKGIPSGTADPSDLIVVLLVLLGIVAVLAIVVVAVPKLRAAAIRIGGQLKEALAVLRSPAAVVELVAWNLAAELLFSLTIWIVLQAFGQDVGFGDVIIINEAVALFAGLMPVPGGVGVTEAALTAGFTAVGVPETVAFSAALCYRMCTFYLPPMWGYFAFNSLRNDGYL
ncbi:MAG: flippase-like domain-containing protein, partial [Ilumatobacteraceae bacterium]|nr:flippase-like domain-containing protein [Ilumatobacteraceae bacterium]